MAGQFLLTDFAARGSQVATRDHDGGLHTLFYDGGPHAFLYGGGLRALLFNGELRAIVMTLDINNRLVESGKYMFSDSMAQAALDENWEHTQLELDRMSPLYESQQIRSYKSTAVILFTEKKLEQVCNLLTLDICPNTGSKVRSYYSATCVTDVALYTEPGEIYLMKKDGTVVLYDATKKIATVKISSPPALLSPQITTTTTLQDVSSVVYLRLSYHRCSGYIKSNSRMSGEKMTPGQGGWLRGEEVTEVLQHHNLTD